MKLLDIEKELSSKDNKTHICYEFEVPDRVSVLYVYFEYTPKFLEGKEACNDKIKESLEQYPHEMREQMMTKRNRFDKLPNMLSVSIDDPEGFRGNVHRHFIEDVLIIDADKSGPGILKRSIEPGDWKITISIHGIVSETVKYTLQVKGGMGNENMEKM